MILLVIHIIVCAFYLLGCRQRRGEDRFPTAIVLLVPFTGIIMYGVDRFILYQKFDGTKEVDLEKLKVTDAKYKKLKTDQSTVGNNTVPLEDALVVNDTKLRRALMLDIIHESPEEYLGILERASISDDSEVTHYATTTLLEIQSEYEYKIQRYMKRIQNNTADRNMLMAYRDCLNAYINSGLIDNTVQKKQQENLLDVLGRLLASDDISIQDLYLYIETCLNLKKYVLAEDMLNIWEKKCIEDEEWYKLKVKLLWENNRTDEIREVLKFIKERKVYLSREGKKWYEFWNKGSINE